MSTHSTGQPANAAGLSVATIAVELRALRDDVRRSVGEDAAGRGSSSVDNMRAYLALRRHDNRELQAALARLGLSSLGRSEGHVLATLEQVLGIVESQPGWTARQSTRRTTTRARGPRWLRVFAQLRRPQEGACRSSSICQDPSCAPGRSSRVPGSSVCVRAATTSARSSRPRGRGSPPGAREPCRQAPGSFCPSRPSGSRRSRSAITCISAMRVEGAASCRAEHRELIPAQRGSRCAPHRDRDRRRHDHAARDGAVATGAARGRTRRMGSAGRARSPEPSRGW
jgi:hypothetical protein